MSVKEEILEKVKAATAVQNSSNKEYEFDIDVLGYKGHFKVKHPSLMDQMDIGVRRAKLINGADPKSLDTITDNLSYITATLAVVLLEAPKWFDLTKLDEYEVIWSIYGEYKKWNETFRRRDASSSDARNSKDATNEGSMENNEDVSSSNK